MNAFEIIISGIAAAFATKIIDRNSQPGASLSAPGPNPSTAQTIFVPAHVRPGARLLTDTEIAQQNYSIGMSTSDRKRFVTEALPMLASEHVDVPPKCGGQNYQGPQMKLVQTAAQKGAPIALTAVGIGGTAATIATFGVGAAIAILGIIRAHHAAAVRREQALECALIPPANHALDVIENAVVNRVIDPQQGQQALDQLHIDFTNAFKGGPGGLREARGTCNAGCWYSHFLAAIAMKKQNRYSQLI